MKWNPDEGIEDEASMVEQDSSVTETGLGDSVIPVRLK